MAAVSLLVDTDVFIDYLNTGRFAFLFDPRSFTVYYSVVTRKELLAKRGLLERERAAIVEELRRCRMIEVTPAIARRYSELRSRHPAMEKEDALLAASALVRRLPLVTRNRRHFRAIEGLVLPSLWRDR